MKQLFLLLLLFVGLTARAQTPGWTFVHAIHDLNGVMDVATDPSGNYYVTGRFYNSLTLGATQLSAPGLCLYIAKCKPSGEVLQVTKVLASVDAIPYSLAVDASGEAYVTGAFRGTLIDGTGRQLTSRTQQDGQPGEDVFILKSGRNGTVQWLRQISSTRPYYYYYSSNQGQSIAVDHAGNSYVTGTVSGTTVQFDPKTTFSDRYSQAFLASYSAKGELRWARVVEGVTPQGPDFTPGSMSNGGAVVVNQSGEVYLSGTTYGGWRLDGSTVLHADYSNNVYLARFEATKGRLLWANATPGVGDGRSLALAGKGEVYLADSFYGTVRFGSSTLTSQGSTDIFVARYDDKGRALYAASLGTATGDYPGDLAADASSGRVFLTGVRNLSTDFPSTSQAFLTGLDPQLRTLKTELVGGPGTSSGAGLALDKHNNIYTTGIFTGTAEFGSLTVSSPYTAAYVARYGSHQTRPASPKTNQAVNIYPNPASSHFRLTLENAADNPPVRATLYNSFGQAITEQKTAPVGPNMEASFSTAGLPRGIYVLRLEYKQETVSRSITVE